MKIAVSVDEARITNDNLFVSTGDYRFVLRILADGKPVWSTTRRFDVAAGESASFEVDWPVDDYRSNAEELVLEVSQQLGNACDWAPAGYELAFGQCVVAGAKTTADAVDAAGAPADGTVTLGRWNAGVRGQGREALFSRAQGGMVSYTFGEREFVLRRPSITTFRPLTDNDRGAGHAFERAAWAVAGKYARCVDCAIANRGENAVEATYTYELAIPQRTKVTVRYVADTAGLVSLDVEYPGEKNGDLPTIPAFGIEWALPVEYANLRFYGAGPEETYADRKTGALIGLYNAKPFAMSLLPYSSTMLEEALHQDELPKPRHMFLRLLAAQMGVGGDDSWMSPVHEQYQLPAGQPLSLNVQLKLF